MYGRISYVSVSKVVHHIKDLPREYADEITEYLTDNMMEAYKERFPRAMETQVR